MEVINNEYQDCIDFLNDLSQACFECLEYSLEADDFKKRNHLIKSLLECAEHAKMTTGFITRQSFHSKEMALISAHLARVTSDECEDFEDEITKITGQVCLETHKMLVDAFNDKDILEEDE